jgi:hypothetical protein
MKDVGVYYNIINSSIATGIAEIITLPICTVKTNYQNSMPSNLSILQTIQTMYKNNGLKIFYSASFPAISSQIISTSSKFVIYKYLDTNNIITHNKWANGFISGILSSLITHPIDVFKIHWQMKKNVFCEISKYNLSILYRGYSKSFIKSSISCSIFFPLYDTLQRYIENKILNSVISSTIATVIIHPIDYLKTRHIAGLSLYNGLNPINYYRGLTLNMFRIVPHFVITMYCIEKLSNNN